MAWTFIQYPARPGAHCESTRGALPKMPPTQKKRYSMDDAKDGKSKALAAALSQIEKQFGKGSIMKMDDAAIRDIDVVSTGSLGLDLALGVGGLPRGRVDEIYGPESPGKTALSLQSLPEVHQIGE